MRHEQITKLEKSFAESIHNIYANAARFHWDSAFIQQAIKTNIYNDGCWKRLPRYAQSFVIGVRHHCDYLHWKLVEFSYVVKGRRLVLSSPQYRKINPQYIHANCTDSGAYVYKDNHDKLFTLPKE